MTERPCRYCGAEEGPPDHIKGERKCCPDCDHRPVEKPPAKFLSVREWRTYLKHMPPSLTARLPELTRITMRRRDR